MNLSRRALLALVATRRDCTVAGAIRWDAWHGERSQVGKAVQRSLSPEKWHRRLPFFAEVLAKDQVRIDGAIQIVMDREIGYARLAGLDYWAFLLYGEGSAMNHGLEHYLASGNRRRLRFCLILERDRWASERAAKLMAHPDYQRVAGGRPLVYILVSNGEANAGAALNRLRTLARENGAGMPYVVILYFDAKSAAALRQEANADAIGAYAYQRDGRNAPYAQLARETEQFWEECRGTGSAVVPIVMTGWDRRPRVEQPVFWETWQQPNAGIEKFYAAPTPEELSRHLGHALEWVKAHPDAAPAKAVLIYAWNENDEGGWLVPTIGDGVSRLRAVRRALRSGR